MGCNTSQEQNTSPENLNENGAATSDEIEAAASNVEAGVDKVASSIAAKAQRENGKLSRENSRNEVEAKLQSITDGGNKIMGGAAATANAIKSNESEKLENEMNHQLNGEADTNGMDLDGSPEEAEAAVKIQAVFRGHKARAKMKQEDTTSTANTQEANNEPEPTKEELEAEFDPNDKELCNAAIRIQSTFRGHLARKEKTDEALKPDELSELTKKVAEELDIDMNDPELHKAASKIQASFRGHKSRREDEPTAAAK